MWISPLICTRIVADSELGIGLTTYIRDDAETHVETGVIPELVFIA
jgi:hypothetical protein